MGLLAAVDGFFGITERGSTIRTEVKGGILVFLAMSYIIAVNSGMMAAAGMDQGSAMTATIVMSTIGCVVMALYARYPLAMAPGMGINAMFCYTAVGAMGYTWQEALLAVVISGLLFFVLTVSGVRNAVLSRIPEGVKSGIIAGIGLFIAFVGLQNAGIIVSDPSTIVSLGDLSEPSVLLAFLCIVVTILFVSRSRSAGIIAGMAVAVVVGVIFGIIDVPDSLVAVPSSPDAGAFIDGIGEGVLGIDFLVLVIAFAFVEFFDGSGTLMAVRRSCGVEDEKGYARAFQVDAGVASLSGAVGCTPTVVFAESTVGTEVGAKTGLMSLVVAALFCLSLFLSPLFGMMGFSCTVGAMTVVGASMLTQLREVRWEDLPATFAVLFTMLFMVLTYSITDGIAMGIIAYCVAMVGARRWREVSVVMYVLAVIFVAYLVMTSTLL